MPSSGILSAVKIIHTKEKRHWIYFDFYYNSPFFPLISCCKDVHEIVGLYHDRCRLDAEQKLITTDSDTANTWLIACTKCKCTSLRLRPNAAATFLLQKYRPRSPTSSEKRSHTAAASCGTRQDCSERYNAESLPTGRHES